MLTRVQDTIRSNQVMGVSLLPNRELNQASLEDSQTTRNPQC